MKKSQDLRLYFAAMLAMLMVYVFAAAQLPAGPGILYGIVGALGACALGQVVSDLLENRRNK